VVVAELRSRVDERPAEDRAVELRGRPDVGDREVGPARSAGGPRIVTRRHGAPPVEWNGEESWTAHSQPPVTDTTRHPIGCSRPRPPGRGTVVAG
jgi:hypothetical protein